MERNVPSAPDPETAPSKSLPFNHLEPPLFRIVGRLLALLPFMKWIGIVLALFATTPLLHADIVHMKDGRVLQGVIVKVNEHSITLQKGIRGARIFSVLPRAEIAAIRLGATDLEPERQRANRYLRDRSFEDAVRTWKYINALEPDRTKNRLGLARALRLAGDLEEAARTAGGALRISPDDPSIHLELGDIAFAAGDFSAAIRHAKAADEHPGSAAFLLLARACIKAGRMEEATRAFRKALDADPGNGQVHSRLIRHLVQSREWEPAERFARERVKRKPRERKGWLILGQVLHVREKYGEAIRVFKKAITLGGPGFDRARVFLLVTEARQAGRHPFSMIKDHDLVLAWELEPELRRKSR